MDLALASKYLVQKWCIAEATEVFRGWGLAQLFKVFLQVAQNVLFLQFCKLSCRHFEPHGQGVVVVRSQSLSIIMIECTLILRGSYDRVSLGQIISIDATRCHDQTSPYFLRSGVVDQMASKKVRALTDCHCGLLSPALISWTLESLTQYAIFTVKSYSSMSTSMWTCSG